MVRPATRVPTGTAGASVPFSSASATTSPYHSCPNTCGKRVLPSRTWAEAPSRISKSVPQMPTCRVRTSKVPGSGSGTGSRVHSTLPGSAKRAARIAPPGQVPIMRMPPWGTAAETIR